MSELVNESVSLEVPVTRVQAGRQALLCAPFPQARYILDANQGEM